MTTDGQFSVSEMIKSISNEMVRISGFPMTEKLDIMTAFLNLWSSATDEKLVTHIFDYIGSIGYELFQEGFFDLTAKDIIKYIVNSNEPIPFISDIESAKVKEELEVYING